MSASDDGTGRPPGPGVLHFVVLDALAAILERSDSLRNLGPYLTDLMREFSGARLTALVQFGGESSATADRVVGICPARAERATDPASIIRVARAGTDARHAAGPRSVTDAAVALADGDDQGDARLVLPLTAGERLAGAMVMIGLPEPEFRTPAVREFLEPLAGVIGLVMRNAMLFEQQETIIAQRTMALVEDIAERERVEEALNWELRVNTVLTQLSNHLMTGTNDVHVVADQVLQAACMLTGAARGFVAELDDTASSAKAYLIAMNTTVSERPNDAPVQMKRNAEGRFDGLRGLCLNTREAFFTNRPAEHPAATAVPADHDPVSQFLAVPVLFGGRLLGEIALANAPQGFSERHLAGMQRVGELYALAVQRRRVEAERQSLEQQLRQSQKLEAIGTLAGGIAHDFNNILTPIMAEVGLALDNLEPGSRLHDALSRVEVAAARARDLVKQILVFSRRQEAERRPVQVDEVVGEVSRLLRSSLPSTIAITAEVRAPGATVFADPSQIHQLLMNLGVNAGHAMRESGGRLEFTLDRVADAPPGATTPDSGAAGWARLSVSDTGVGMDAATRDRIFEPYFTTKGLGEGTGLGLAVVHGVVTRCGGAIDVESEPGKGTTFTVYLPLVAGTTASGPLKRSPARGRGEHILLVDDEQSIVDVGSQILRRFGYAVTAVTSSVEALELFRSDPDRFDLVISDQTLPRMTGAALLKAILAVKPSARVVLMTGYSETLDEREAAAIGAAAFLMKPFTLDGLAEITRQALGKT